MKAGRKIDEYLMQLPRGADARAAVLERWAEVEQQDLVNTEAEMAMLGAVLHNNRALERVIGFLKPEHFGNRVHGRIFEAMLRLHDHGTIADPITLKVYFETDGDLVEVGGFAYLMRLAGSVASILSAEDYGATIHDLALRRAGIVQACNLLANLTSPELDEPAGKLITAAENSLSELSQDMRTGRGLRSYVDIAKDFANEIDQAAKGQAPIIECGIPDLDRLLGLRRGHQLLLAGATSMGKAQPLDSLVLLRDGAWRRICDLRLGDHLASVDGAPSRVAGIFPQGERMAWRVTFKDGRSVEACAEHLWRVRSWRRTRVIDTAALARLLAFKSNRNRLSVEMVSGDFGDAAVPLDGYVLGALIGDGNLTTATPRFSTADAEVLAEISARLEGVAAVRKMVGRYDYSVTRPTGDPLRSNTVTTALRDLGLMGLRSESKFIPPIYFQAPRAVRLDLLRGLLDTDGWVEASGTVRFSSASRALAEGVVDLARSLGAVCRMRQRTTTFTSDGVRRAGLDAYQCTIRHPTAEDLFLLPRKSARARRTKHVAPRLTVVSVEAVAEKPMACIAVTHPSRLYVTNGYTVTHNTALAGSILYNIARYIERHETGEVIVHFSLEMKSTEMFARHVAPLVNISADAMLGEQLEMHHYERILEAMVRVGQLPILMLDVRGMTTRECRAELRKIARKRRIRVIGLDHLGLLRHPNPRIDQRLKIAEFSLETREWAEEFNAAVIALAQLKRYARPDMRPTLDDLKETSDLEQNADTVAFVYREEYYTQRKQPQEGTTEFVDWQIEMERLANKAEVNIAKRRMGPTGRVFLHYDGPTTTFTAQSWL